MRHPPYLGLLGRLGFRLALRTRHFRRPAACQSFGDAPDVISRLYVINLDRQPQRWAEIQRELRHVSDREGIPLLERTKRFSAVDAREAGSPPDAEVKPSYRLAHQLYVEPQLALPLGYFDLDQPVEMTPQEIAVARSHIAVWKHIAVGGDSYALVLEDDVYLCRAFARQTDSAWADLRRRAPPPPLFDVFYLSYEEAKNRAQKEDLSDSLFRPIRGLWNLSGYVLSKDGAAKLVALLPVNGPVDLWLNHKFEDLDVVASATSLIDQRPDQGSENSYSILPVLAKVGVLEREKPALFQRSRLPEPVFAFSLCSGGLTALATALSMLGYRCCSDVTRLPHSEQTRLVHGKRRRVFTAYVNVGSLQNCYLELAETFPDARFIVIDSMDRLATEQSGRDIAGVVAALRGRQKRVLVISAAERGTWKVLCEFLQCVPPACEYPVCCDHPQREVADERCAFEEPRGRRLRWDTSPWIVEPRPDWTGIKLCPVARLNSENSKRLSFDVLDYSDWQLRDDTFPGNLALFVPGNFSAEPRTAKLAVRAESVGVRAYTSAAVSSRRSFLYGHFETVLRPARVAGLVTGMFLHRHSPKQEIDIEFLGRDTTKILINVYYNPGGEGARFDYGYRGTPVLVDLGFDASLDFHRYGIEWSSTAMRWFVDGTLIHQRSNWDPTPIPHLPMQLHINLWPPRSLELAGRLRREDLPAYAFFRSLDVCSGGS